MVCVRPPDPPASTMNRRSGSGSTGIRAEEKKVLHKGESRVCLLGPSEPLPDGSKMVEWGSN